MSDVPRPMILFLKEYFKTKKNITCIEIGVEQGINAFNILQELPIKKIILIDPYTPYVQESQKFDTEECFMIAKEKLSRFQQVTFLRKTSDEAVRDIHEQLDFVYIDGNHSYENVHRDIINYFPLIKHNGVIGGHDYFPLLFKGVVKAVNEFADEYGRLNFHVVYPDWWIIKEGERRLK
jgi:predicted O-methyltransferase YrrM